MWDLVFLSIILTAFHASSSKPAPRLSVPLFDSRYYSMEKLEDR